jgi:hypothetical protein
MSFFSEKNIPFGVKASNLASVANFSSTLEDSYILIIANNCNVPVDNGNSYDTIYNDYNNAALFGVNVNATAGNSANQEAYIGIKRNDFAHKIAKFNSESISLDVNTIINGNLLPSISSNYDLGAFVSKWKSLYLSDSLHATRIYGDGSGITNLNLSAKTTDELNEGPNASNLYFTTERASDVINTCNIAIYETLDSLSNLIIEKAIEVANNIDFRPVINEFTERFATLNADQVAQGTSNKMIVDDIYNSDLYVDGSLITSNLIVLGSTTTVTNNVYNSQRLEIVNDSAIPGAAVSIMQYGVQPTELLNASFRGLTQFVIKSQGNVGIGVTNPISKLQVAGDVRASSFIGSGANLTSVNLRDRTTSMLSEGCNLYYTPARVGTIVTASNLNVSNYVSRTATTLATTITNTSNTLTQRITTSASDTSNYVKQTSNILTNFITSKTKLLENFLGNTSNSLQAITDSIYLNSQYNYSNLSNLIRNTQRIITSNVAEQQQINNLLQLRIDNKEDFITGAASTIKTNNLVGNRVVISGISGKIGVSSVTTSELASLSGVSGNIQEQFSQANDRITNLNADQIQNGQVNKFIVNNEYDDYLYVKKAFYTSNLNVFDKTTYINTHTLNASNFQIVNEDAEGPSFSITHKSLWFNIVEIWNDNPNNNHTPVFMITQHNNVGIGVSNPSEKLEVDGTIKGTVFKGSGSGLSGVNLGDKSTSDLIEGSNLYFTTDRVAVLIDSSNNDLSNLLVNNIIEYATNTSNTLTQYIDTQLSTQISLASQSNQDYAQLLYLDSITYTALKTTDTSNDLSSRMNNIVENIQNFVTTEIFSGLDLSNVDCNVLLQGFAEIDRRITKLNTDQIKPATHNRFIVDNVYDDDLIVTGKLTVSSLEVTDLGMVYEAADGSIINSDILSYIDYMTSNVYLSLNDGVNGATIQAINDRVSTLTTDDITQPMDTNTRVRNKFIVDNVYDNDLTVTGKLTVSMLEVTDLGMVYEAADGSTINTDIQTYVNHVTSNLYANMYDGLTITNINNMSNQLAARISALNADQINDTNTHNRFIVDNVYDNDLTVTGRLTVSSLEVTDLGMVYEAGDGSTVNSDLKTYVEYVASNIFDTKFDGADAATIARLTRRIDNISNLTTDDIKPGAINSFIVNNVYDNNLTVTGKLTVSSLEVTDLGVTYEDPDGEEVNTDLQGYIDYKVSNIYDVLYKGLDVNDLNTDRIKEATHNKYIVDNVYDNDLVVTGKLTVSSLEVTDLGMVYEADDGSTMNTNLQSYVNYVTSNVYQELYSGINNEALSNVQSSLSKRIDRLSTDDIKTNSNAYNRFIVNHVYDHSLTVLGKLTVNSLEVTNLGVTYEDPDGEDINTDLQGYVQWATSNVYAELYDGVNNHTIAAIYDRILQVKTDEVKPGEHNRFIVNDVYDRDLVVTGKLTVSSLEVTDLGMVYEAGDGSSINTNIEGYVNYVASNIYAELYDGFNVKTIIDASNQLAARISALNTDQINDASTHNRFIVDNVYDNDLTVTGRLTVSSLEVTDLGMVYEAGDGSTVNSDLKTYVAYVASNIFDTKFDGADNSVIAKLTKRIDNISNLTTDDIKPGAINSFIVNNVYDNNLTVTGKLTVSSLEVTDLGVTYEDPDGEEVSTDLQGYIDYKVSNVYEALYKGLDINDLNTDTVKQATHNKYIVDNVYDNDLTVTGKLTVSSLEVTDLGMVYEAADGTTVNSGIKGYIDYVTCNLFRDDYAWVNDLNLSVLSCNVDVFAKYITPDMLGNGVRNKFITDNVYDQNLTVTGKLTVGSLEVTDLGITYDPGNGSNVNSDLQSYVNYATSNVYAALYQGVDNSKISNLHRKIDALTTDNIKQTETNRYIVKNVYDDDLVVTGRLTVQSLTVTDLGVTYENTDGDEINSDLQSYIDYVASNIYAENFDGVNKTVFQSLQDQVNSLNTDDLATADTAHNRFIVDHVYDNDLVVTGKLTVSSLEVTDLGMVYEANDGSLINTNIQSYVDYVASNVFEQKFAATSNDIYTKIKNISADEIQSDGHKKFIVDNVYDNNLVVTGKLTVTSLEVTNLGVTYEDPDAGEEINTDLKTYIDYVTSNVFDQRLQGIDNDKLLNMSNDFKTLVNNIDSDAIKERENAHQRFIIDDVYDRDLVVTGKLTVSSLEVTDLGMTYEAGDAGTVNSSIQDYVKYVTSNVVADLLDDLDTAKLQELSNNVLQVVENIRTDQIRQTASSHNRFIVDNVYDNNLTVTGKLTVSSLEVTDLGVTYEDADGEEVNSDIQSYVRYVTSNAIDDAFQQKFAGIDTQRLQELSNSVLQVVENIQSDQIKEVEGAHQRFIVDNVYDNDLIVTGKLTVSSLEVTDLGMVYESGDGTTVNSDIQGYVRFVTSNVVEDRLEARFAGIDTQRLAEMSNSIMNIVDNLNADEIEQGVHQRFIVDNVYEHNLTVLGKLTVTSLEVTDLGLTYEDPNAGQINTDLQNYVKYVTNNVVEERFQGIDNAKLDAVSNYVSEIIDGVSLDLLRNGNNNRFIVNNVYDDNLVVTGKLTVSSLEVTDLGVTYEDLEGDEINTDLQTYINYVSSNVFGDLVDHLDISSKLNNIQADQIKVSDTSHNRFVVDDVYDSDLVVTGKLTVSSLEVTDLGMVYEAGDGQTVNSSIQEYVKFVTSNVVSKQFGGINNTKLQELSNNVLQVVENIRTDQIKMPASSHNKFIVDNVYDNNLTVTGKLTVSSLEVTDLGVKYEDADGEEMNTDLRSYIDYVTCNILDEKLQGITEEKLNNISNEFKHLIQNINSDSIVVGTHNRFIVDDVYDSDLVVTGRLTVSSLEVTDLGMVYEAADGSAVNSDIQSYVRYITCNALSERYAGIDTGKLQEFSNNIESLIQNVNTDQIKQPANNHNKFIVDNVYDNDLIVTGKLTVSSLEVTDLGMVYEAGDGSTVNSDIQGYITYVASNIVRDSFAGIDTAKLTQMSNNFEAMIRAVDVDKITVSETSHNRFIVDNVYDDDLVVTGKLTVSSLEVTDLGMVYEAEDGTSVNTNLQAYVNYVACNILQTVDLSAQIKNIKSDQITVLEGAHQRFIVDDVYDSDLVVSGKLTVSSLEVTDLGMVYEAGDAGTVNGSIQDYVKFVTSNVVSDILVDIDTSKLQELSNNVLQFIDNFNIDQLAAGQHNRFIVDNVYDNDLMVTGKLTVSSLEVTDLGMVYESADGSTVNSDIQGYINFVTSNIVSERFGGIDTQHLQELSNNVLQVVENIRTDQIKMPASSHNQFIVDNVYDNDLIVTGKLTVSSLEVTDLGMVYEAGDGQTVNSSIQQYVKFVTSNVVSEQFGGINNTKLQELSNNVLQVVENIRTDQIKETPGSHNKFIVDNVYDNNLVVTGKLTVSSLAVTDLGITYESSNGSNVNSDIKGYVNYVTCNLLETMFEDRFAGIDTAKLTQMSNNFEAMIKAIDVDKLSVTETSHNKFIVDDVYDSDLVVTGKLTVSSLEVTDLGMVYEAADGSTMNTNIQNYIEYVTSNIFDQRLQGLDNDKLFGMSNQFVQQLKSFNADDIAPGVHHKYIIDNVYDNDLIVSGKLTVSSLEVTDLGMVYEAGDGQTVNSDIQGYITYVASNIVSDHFGGINNTKLQELSNNVLQVIENIRTDQIKEAPAAHNKFIVDNVYDNNLVVTGKLTVSSLEVTDLGITYESSNGSNVNSDIKGYVNYVTCNLLESMFEDRFAGIDTAKLTQMSNNFEAMIRAVDVDKLLVTETSHNKFIVDDVYDSDLVVTGKLTVSSLEVTDLGMVYEAADGSTMNTNIQNYIEYVTCNLVSQQFAGIDTQRLEELSNATWSLVQNINADQIKVPDVSHNKFIVDNVYDNDLVVMGTLTVSNLEVVGLGISYTSSDGCNVNTNIQNYVRYMTSNVVEERFGEINNTRLQQLSNNVLQVVENIRTDQIKEAAGAHNRFIIDNVYDDDLIVTGRLTVSSLEVTDLGMVYEAADGATVNSDIQSYVRYVTSNVVSEQFGGINTAKLQELSNNVLQVVENIQTDQIKASETSHNKFIVDNVYDNDLVVTGKLTVSSLEVTDLGMVYEAGDGQTVNSDIQSYVKYIASNFVTENLDTRFGGIDSSKLQELSNNVLQVVENIRTDQIKETASSHNRFIVDDVYDRDLVVTGKLTVSSLEVTDLGMVYESGDGSTVNSDIQGYVTYVTSNIIYNKFADQLEFDVDRIKVSDVSHRQFIVDNVYDDDLVVTGKLTVSSLEVTDLGMVYEAADGQTINSDVQGYIKYIASNLFEDKYAEVNVDSLITMSNSLVQVVKNINSDQISVDASAHNRFIVDNVYDNDLVVTGKLTVSSLEVTDLGMVYEASDGSTVNSDIQAYVKYITSNTIGTINTDQLPQGSKNKYIVDNLYDSDLMVSGRLAASALQITDGNIDIVYEQNGTVMNKSLAEYITLLVSQMPSPTTLSLTSEIQEYIRQVSSNLLLAVSSGGGGQQQDTQYIDVAGQKADYITNGVHKKFIIDNVYDNDLVVTGKLTASTLEVTDLGMVYESADGDIVSTNIKGYIDYITSNLFNSIKFVSSSGSGSSNTGFFILDEVDKSTSTISEGCNLYFTPARVARIVDASNVNTSNQIAKVSSRIDDAFQLLNTRINTKYDNISNYVASATSSLAANLAASLSNSIASLDIITDADVQHLLNASNQQLLNYFNATLITNVSNIAQGTIQTSIQDYEDQFTEYIRAVNQRVSSLTTNHIPEGSNLYYTPQRVGVIARASNIDTSNYVRTTTNQLRLSITENFKYLNDTIIQTRTNLTNKINTDVLRTTDDLNATILQTNLQTCNYVSNIAGDLRNTFSSNLGALGTTLSNRVTQNDTNVSNYVLNTREYITNVSNYAANSIATVYQQTTNHTNNVSNYAAEYIRAINQRVSSLSTNQIPESSNLYYTAERVGVIARASNIDTSNYIRTTGNQLRLTITENFNYLNDTIIQTRTNLTNKINTDVLRTTDDLNATILQTNLQTCNYVSNIVGDLRNTFASNLATTVNKVTQNDTNMSNYVLNMSNYTANYVANVYQQTTNHIDNVSNYATEYIRGVNQRVSGLSTNHIPEASNLYYTPQRVGVIARASNIDTSNYIRTTANQLRVTITENFNYLNDKIGITETNVNNKIDNLRNQTVQNLSDTCNVLLQQLTATDQNMSNYMYDTNTSLLDTLNQNVNRLDGTIATNDANASNYVASIYQDAQNKITNTCNYATELNQRLNQRVSSLSTNNIPEASNLYYTPQRVGVIARASNIDTSNYIRTTANQLRLTLTETAQYLNDRITVGDASLNIKIDNLATTSEQRLTDTSNVISQRITQTDAQMSNYLFETAGDLRNSLTATFSSNLGALGTTLSNRVTTNDYNMSNYVLNIYDTTSNRVTDVFNYATEYIRAVNQRVSSLSTNQIPEGSNLYYTAQRVGVITRASNIDTSNYIRTATNQLRLTLTETTQYLNDRITVGDAALNIRIDNLTTASEQKLADASNIINQRITQTDTQMSNYVNRVHNALYTDLRATSNILLARLSDSHTTLSNLATDLTNVLRADLNTNVSNLDQNMSNIAYQISANLVNTDLTMSNYVSTSLNRVDRQVNSRISALNTGHIPEGSNLYYTPARVGAIATASNLNVSNYVRLVTNDIKRTVANNFDTLYTYVVLADKHIEETSNEITTRINNLDIPQSVSTLLAISISETSNYISSTQDKLEVLIQKTKLDNFSTNALTEGSNLFYTPQRVARLINASNANTIAYVNEQDRMLNNRIIESADSLYGILKTKEFGLSNYVKNLNADQIADGNSHRFIINDEYNRDIKLRNIDVTGDIVPTSNSAYSLGTPTLKWKDLHLSGNTIYLSDTVIESDPSTKSLIIKDKYDEPKDVNNFNTNMSNYVLETYNKIIAKISALRTDDISDDQQHHRYIVDNVYDNNLVVTGKLTVSMLEVIDLEMVYEEDGNTINADLKSYIDWVSSNIIYNAYNLYSRVVVHTSNQLTQHFVSLDKNMSNYLSETDTRINTRVTNLDTNMSNYLMNTDVTINTRVSNLDTNMSNYLMNTDTTTNTRVTNLDTNMSNYLSNTDITINNRVSNLDTNMSNYLSNTDTTINNRVSKLDTNMSNYLSITDITINAKMSNLDTNMSNYMYNTDTTINSRVSSLNTNMSNFVSRLDTQTNTRITNLTADQIANGSVHNRFIVDDVYNRDLFVNGTLIASNLDVIGTTTIIDTATYQTENLEIISQATDGPALKVVQNGIMDIAQFVNTSSNIVAVIKRDGKVGIGNTAPAEKLDVSGNIKLTGSLNGITNVQLGYLSDISNPVQQQINNLNSKTGVADAGLSNYVKLVDTKLSASLTTNDASLSNYMQNTVTKINVNDAGLSNYVRIVNSGLSNYVKQVDTRVTTVDAGLSNYISIINMGLSNSIQTVNAGLSNYVKQVDTRVTTVDAGLSNYVRIVNSGLSNYIKQVDTRVTSVDAGLSNYVKQVDTKLVNLNADKILNGTSNQFITNGTYNNNLFVVGTLRASNLDIIGTTTTINTNAITNEKLQIVSLALDGPSASITQNGNSTNDVLRVTCNSNNYFVVTASGNVGIGTGLPSTKLDVNGQVKATGFIGDGHQLYNINLGDKSTSELAEGSNLYYTAARVGTLIDSSNVAATLQMTTYVNTQIGDAVELVTARIDSSNVQTITQMSTYVDSRIADTKQYINVLISNSNVLMTAYIDNNINILSTSVNSNLQVLSTYVGTYVDNSLNLLTGNVNSINDKVDNLVLDQIGQGTTNTFIVNNIHSSDLIVQGALGAQSINITNYAGYNPVLTLSQFSLENAADVIQVYSQTGPLFVMNKDGYIGNVANPEYNVDINGTIRGTEIIGNGQQLFDVNISDKSTSELAEGSNLYYTDERAYAVAERALLAASNMFTLDINSYSNFAYVFDSFKNDVTNTVTNIVTDVQGTIENINDINTLVSSELIAFRNALNNLSMDNIYQGSNYQYIVNNMINSSLLVNGTLTVRDIRILDMDSEFYDTLYNSNLLKGYNNSNWYGSSGAGALDTQNISNIAQSTATRVAKYYSNILQKEFSQEIEGILSTESNLAHRLDVAYSNIADLTESQYHISLDNVVQGDKNKYIVNDIYNSSLIVNGTLMVRDIRIIDIDSDHYTDIYNSNLYDPGSAYTQPAYTIATNMSNIATQVVESKLDAQTNEINMLKSSLQTLTASLDSALQRIAALESALST